MDADTWPANTLIPDGVGRDHSKTTDSHPQFGTRSEEWQAWRWQWIPGRLRACAREPDSVAGPMPSALGRSRCPEIGECGAGADSSALSCVLQPVRRRRRQKRRCWSRRHQTSAAMVRPACSL